MKIEKNNICIRRATSQDAQNLNKWWNDGAIMVHVGFLDGLNESMETTLNAIHHNPSLYMIEIDGICVGELNFNIQDKTAYPGWKICEPSYQNKGYGTITIQLLFEYLFNTLGVEHIIWDTLEENKRAQHVYTHKLGARYLKTVKDAWIDPLGNKRNALYYQMDREDFNHNGR